MVIQFYLLIFFLYISFDYLLDSLDFKSCWLIAIMSRVKIMDQKSSNSFINITEWLPKSNSIRKLRRNDNCTNYVSIFCFCGWISWIIQPTNGVLCLPSHNHRQLDGFNSFLENPVTHSENCYAFQYIQYIYVFEYLIFTSDLIKCATMMKNEDDLRSLKFWATLLIVVLVWHKKAGFKSWNLWVIGKPNSYDIIPCVVR